MLAFLGSFLLVSFALNRGRPDSARWLLLFDVLLNIYPGMLQRSNRVRLQRILRKMGYASERPLMQQQ
jgi:hypothetical protein